ncbi:MAG: HAMP domain-containing sensor histidine kinase [Candidatus Omnitrophota bacterium]|nr:HAMP domain-containing sensor histidine kinase [Candidatus Omnitrophota bacterium]
MHDLNNPLSAAFGNLQLLEIEMGKHLSEEQRKEFRDALEALNAIKNMTADLLDVSLMEENTLKLNKKEINLTEHIKKIINLMSYSAGQEGKVLIPKVSPMLSTLYADEEILQRIISNLVRNALKFTPVNSHIVVCIDYKAENKEFVFCVKDNGIGIPKEYLGKIFDKYVRVDNERTKSVPGKGLGLAFCKMAVETHGGRIWAESEVDKGSTFYFTLPAKTS